MGIKTVPQPPYSSDLTLCDFCLFPKLRGCRYETIEEKKEALKNVIDTLTQEDFHGAFQMLLEQQVHCSRRKLLRSVLEIHAFTINKSAHTKNTGNVSYSSRIYIYIYIYICVCVCVCVCLCERVCVSV